MRRHRVARGGARRLAAIPQGTVKASDYMTQTQLGHMQPGQAAQRALRVVLNHIASDPDQWEARGLGNLEFQLMTEALAMLTKEPVEFLRRTICDRRAKRFARIGTDADRLRYVMRAMWPAECGQAPDTLEATRAAIDERIKNYEGA